MISEKMKFFKEDIKPKILKTLEPFSAVEDAKLCLENNLLVFTVEYLKDLKQIRAIEEGSQIVKEANKLFNGINSRKGDVNLITAEPFANMDIIEHELKALTKFFRK